MIYLTQLIYIQEGSEKVFDEFEAVAIPIIAKYNGKLLLRIRPPASSVVECEIESPYEIHLACFDSDADYEAFKHDEERKRFLYLKDKAIRTVILIQGFVL